MARLTDPEILARYKQAKEDRERWRNIWEYHYDLRPTINGVIVYVETRLSPEDFSNRDDPVIIVVNIKPA